MYLPQYSLLVSFQNYIYPSLRHGMLSKMLVYKLDDYSLYITYLYSSTGLN